MQNDEQCIEFLNNDGQVLRGIIHFSAKENRKMMTLVCLNTGLNDMVGWHRLQVKTARFLAQNGYDVVRFDDIGIGDSDGEINSDSIVEIFADIETGRFLENANLATEFAANKFPENKLVYLGFCGGSVTALLSVAENDLVAGVICIGGPVTVSSNEYLHKQDPWVVNKKVENYKRKISDYQVWLKVITFKVDCRTAIISFWKYFEHKIRGEYKERKDLTNLDCVKNLNKVLFHEFEKVSEKKVPCLFFYADTDSATWEFKKYFLEYFKKKFSSKKYPNTFIEEPNANHILSSIASQKSLNRHITNWLSETFG
jgi:dienelactone hydrolase